jgi:capsular polysaccharide biosynthesis protein
LPELPGETGLLIPEGAPSYVWDTLRWLGLEGRARPTPERHLFIDDFYFLAPTVMQGCLNPAGLQFLRGHFLAHADSDDPALPRRIYLARANKTRGIINYAEVEAFFRTRGWAIVNPETMSLARQIALFAGCEAVCGLHGAAFTNLAWCASGTRVLELFAEGFLNGCYEGIALCLDLPYHWLLFPADGEFRAHVDVGRIAAVLEGWSL